MRINHILGATLTALGILGILISVAAGYSGLREDVARNKAELQERKPLVHRFVRLETQVENLSKDVEEMSGYMKQYQTSVLEGLSEIKSMIRPTQRSQETRSR